MDKFDEFKNIVDRLERAERALKSNGFEDLGGEEWKPPVNLQARYKLYLRFALEKIVTDVENMLREVDEREKRDFNGRL